MEGSVESDKKKNAWKVGVGAAGAVGGAKVLASAGLLKSGFLFKTLGTLFVSLFLYSRLYGLAFAAIVIVLLLVHEMGHWLWMKMKRLDPGAPVFVPFMGAYVAMNKMPGDEATHAWVAFAGPLVGTIGALAIYITGAMTNNAALMAGGNFGFFLNLLQLIPAKPLDGGFIASAVSKWLLIPGTIVVLLLGFACHSILLIIIGGLSAFSLFKKKKAAAAGAEEIKPATGWQRFFIGSAYMSLALFLGVMQIFAGYQMLFNKDYAAGQIQYLSEEIQRSPDSDLFRDRSQCYATVGKMKEAESDIVQAIGSGSDNSDDYLSLARYRLSQGEVDDTTRDALKKAMELTSEHTMDAWKVGFGYLLANDYPNALKAAERCDEADKSDLKAAVLYRTNKLKDAHASYELAVRKESTYMVGTYCQKALMELSEGELPSAKIDIEEAESRDADDPLTIMTRGWYALYSGDADTAVQKADEALKKLESDYLDRSDKFQIAKACEELKAAADDKLIAPSSFYTPLNAASLQKL